MVWTGHMIVLICLHGVVLVSETYKFCKRLYRISEMIVALWANDACSFMNRSTSLVSVLTDLHLCLHLWYTNECMLDGAKWHPTPESGDSSTKTMSGPFDVCEIWTDHSHSSPQSMLVSLQGGVVIAGVPCVVWVYLRSCHCRLLLQYLFDSGSLTNVTSINFVM